MNVSEGRNSKRKSDENDPLTEQSLNLISDLPLHAAHECRRIFQHVTNTNEGYMLLPRLPEAEKIFHRTFISKWTHLLRHGPAEKIFNEKFNEFTEERRQFRPLLDPLYTRRVSNFDMTNPIENSENHIHSILPH